MESLPSDAEPCAGALAVTVMREWRRVDRTTSPAVAMAADELYAGPLDRFVERRRALARALRDAGDAPGSRQVAAMTKPSMTAWAVNQLWWVHRDALDALFTRETAGRCGAGSSWRANERGKRT